MGLEVLVVGGGIGGLSLAAALARDGHAVTVVEKAAQLRPVGAGIVLGINATAALRALGLGEALAQAGWPIRRGLIGDAAGRPIAVSDFGLAADRHGPMLAFYRPELHAVLREAAAASRLVLGETVAALEEAPDGVAARFSSGDAGRYDLVVGADGLHSQVRGLLLGAAAPRPRYSGATCWRFVARLPGGLGEVSELWGGARRLGLVPLRGERVYAFLVEETAAHGRDQTEDLPAMLSARFGDFGGEAPRALAALRADPNAAIMRHDLEDLDGQAWGRGRVALLGDASHATTPNLGQGAGMAIEDALALTLALRGGDVPAALDAFRARREARVAAVVQQSWRLGQLAHWQRPLAVALRDTALRLTPAWASHRAFEALIAPGLALAAELGAATPPGEEAEAAAR